MCVLIVHVYYLTFIPFYCIFIHPFSIMAASVSINSVQSIISSWTEIICLILSTHRFRDRALGLLVEAAIQVSRLQFQLQLVLCSVFLCIFILYSYCIVCFMLYCRLCFFQPLCSQSFPMFACHKQEMHSESTNLRRSGGSGFRTLDSRIRSVIRITTKIVSLGPWAMPYPPKIC